METGSDESARRKARYRITVLGELTQPFVEPLGQVFVESTGDQSISAARWSRRQGYKPFSAGSTEVIIRFGCAIAVRSCIVASPAGTRPRGCVAGARRKRAL
jgi:hypothetical protein